jgi:hypothetical protein
MTTPRGTEMVELPFNLMGRRKKASLEASIPRRLRRPPFSSATGSWSGGSCASRVTRRTRSILNEEVPG